MTRTGTTLASLAILREPTPPDRVLERQGNRKHQGDCQKQYGVCQLPHAMLDYVTARYVMDRLDSIGPDNWQDRYVDRPDGSVRGGIGILIDGEWVWKWDVGTESDIESDKGSYSDAFKRAAVKWGIARDLYPDGKKQQRASSARPQASAPAGPSSPAGDARPLPGSWEGTFATTDSADASVRESKDGPVLKFVLTDPDPYPGMKRINVRVHGELAHAVAVGIASFGKPERVTVWGDLREEAFKAKDGKTVRYLALDATRVMAPEFTVPAATEPAPAAAPVSVAPGASGGEFDDLPF